MKYKTFSGEMFDFSELTHQHLSNVYWYNLIISKLDVKPALRELFRRFNGETLPYKPDYRFKHEFSYLEEYNHLIWSADKTYADIFYQGHIIGTYETLEYIRNKKLTELIG